jgi:hypothetical protein
LSPFVSQKLATFISSQNHEDLVVLKELIEAGKVTPAIDRTYPLREVPSAIGYVKDGHARGKVVITIWHRKPIRITIDGETTNSRARNDGDQGWRRIKHQNRKAVRLNGNPPWGHMTAQSETSVRNASITAKVALLLMSALAGVGNFVSLKGLVTQGNGAQTANNIAGPRACSGSVP